MWHEPRLIEVVSLGLVVLATMLIGSFTVERVITRHSHQAPRLRARAGGGSRFLGRMRRKRSRSGAQDQFR